MNLQQPYYFKVIAELEHYTKASKSLLISQSSLSHSISKLEEELNVPLFYKKGRNVKLTKYGDIFLSYVSRALDEINLGKEILLNLTNPNTGTVSLSYLSPLSTQFIPSIINEFYKDINNSQIKFQLYQNPSQKIIESIKDGSVDLGFCSIPDDPDIDYELIYTQEMVVVVSVKHPWASKQFVDLKELGSESVVTYDNQCGIRVYIDKIFKSLNITPNIKFEVEYDNMIIGIVSANLGLAVMPKVFGLELHNVKVLPIINKIPSRNMYMVWLKNEYMSPATEKFKKFVIDIVP